ncbi:DsbA family protein [Streptomyces meridianus]|uniref:DsbA family protein n=1 Tax=Streptomyces meridianus TaxID=2938945 RepID=A0ABT0X510_9ACTN|nr:thioredoxin domain-containing protein [Streptomyces meridianus]MCM2577627.1 DsbA family protein [Streptomyces meridianus]
MRAARAVSALAAVVLLGLSVTACGSRATGAAGPMYASRDDLPERLAPDGTTIVVGDAKAMPVRLYEDMRCPVCEEFEVRGASSDLLEMTLRRQVRTEYVLASFLDDRAGGSGSKKAANALRAALEEGKFVEYHARLFENQPEEAIDGYTDAFLLDMASLVDGLRGPAFDSAVREMKYADFVAASERAFDESGAPGTPTMDINGRRLPEWQTGVLFEKGLLPLYIRDRNGEPAG